MTDPADPGKQPTLGASEGKGLFLETLDSVTPVDVRPTAVIVDIDGTVALRGDRSPYNYAAVLEDKLNEAVAQVVRAMYLAGHQVVYLSGRPEQARRHTEQWLGWHFHFRPAGLYMRADGDGRDDAIVKEELYRDWIEPDLRVICVLDDRNKVVDMWRRIGLPCLQVAPGDF